MAMENCGDLNNAHNDLWIYNLDNQREKNADSIK